MLEVYGQPRGDVNHPPRATLIKRQLQMIDDPVHNGILRDESDDLHSAATLGADHRIYLIDLPDHLGPALGMAPSLLCLDCHIASLFPKTPSIGAFSPISQIPATPPTDPPPRVSCKFPISKLYSSQEWPSYGSSETLIPHFIFLSLRYPPPTQP